MLYVPHIIILLQFLFGFELCAFSSNEVICKHKEKIDSIVIGGIRAPGHWLYPSVDKVYGIEDEQVLIINDFSIAHPDIQIEVNNEALPILEKSLACLKGSIKQIIFEHVGYGLQEKNFNEIMPFLISLLKPGGKIVYISYRVPFSRSSSQLRQRQEYLPIVPDLCQLLGIPEPRTIHEFLPHQKTPKEHCLEKELNELNHLIHQKIKILLENNSCSDVENDPEILRLMKKVKTILSDPYFSKPLRKSSSIDSYSPLHNKILNCASNLFHEEAVCDIRQNWQLFRVKKSPCSETQIMFEKAGLIVQSVAIEHTDNVFAFKIIAQKYITNK